MSDAPKRRGRPPKAARTLDEALAAVYAGSAPARPRNAHERQAAQQRRGRKPNPASATQQAAGLVEYRVRTGDATSVAAASRDAAAAFRVNADNVRKYAARKLQGAMVELPHKGASTWAGRLPSSVAPLVVEIRDHLPLDEAE